MAADEERARQEVTSATALAAAATAHAEVATSMTERVSVICGATFFSEAAEAAEAAESGAVVYSEAAEVVAITELTSTEWASTEWALDSKAEATALVRAAGVEAKAVMAEAEAAARAVVVEAEKAARMVAAEADALSKGAEGREAAAEARHAAALARAEARAEAAETSAAKVAAAAASVAGGSGEHAAAAPTQADVLDYAEWLGMLLPEENDLLWIASEGLMQPLPSDDWSVCRTTGGGELYYFHAATGESTWAHPADATTRELLANVRRRRDAEAVVTKEGPGDVPGAAHDPLARRHIFAAGELSQIRDALAEETEEGSEEGTVRESDAALLDIWRAGEANRRASHLSDSAVTTPERPSPAARSAGSTPERMPGARYPSDSGGEGGGEGADWFASTLMRTKTFDNDAAVGSGNEQLRRAFAWLSRVAYSGRKTARALARAARWQGGIGARFRLRKGWAALTLLLLPNAPRKMSAIGKWHALSCAWRAMRARCEARASKPTLPDLLSLWEVECRRAVHRWYRHACDPATQVARMRMGQVVARLSRSRRRRNLAGAVNSMKYATRLAEFEVHMAGTARYLVLRARLYRWIRRLGALRGSWMVDDATWRWGRVARREALATWRMTTSRALVASADGRRILLRSCWCRFALRIEHVRRVTGLRDGGRARCRRFELRRGLRCWRALSARVLESRRLGAVGRGARDARRRVRRILLEALLEWREWREWRAIPRPLYIIDARYGHARTCLHYWSRSQARERRLRAARRFSYGVCRTRAALRLLASSQIRSQLAHKMLLVADLHALRYARRIAVRRWAEATIRPPPPPPPVAKVYRWMPPKRSAEGGPWVPSGDVGVASKHRPRPGGRRDVLMARQLVAAAAAGSGDVRAALAGPAAVVAEAALAGDGLFSRPTTSPRPRATGYAGDDPPPVSPTAALAPAARILPAPGTAAYHGGRIGRARDDYLEEAWAAAQLARNEREAAAARSSAARTNSRKQRIAGRSWTPSLSDLEHATVGVPNPGRWRTVPVAVPIGVQLPITATGDAQPVPAAAKPAPAPPRRPPPRAVPLHPPHEDQAPDPQHWDGRSLPASVNLILNQPKPRAKTRRSWR